MRSIGMVGMNFCNCALILIVLTRKKALPTKKKIFDRKPTVCADNFFFDNELCDWIAKNRFSSIRTTERNVLPDGIEKKYVHVEKNPVGCPCSKAA